MAEFIIRVLKWLAALVVAYALLFVLLIVFLIGLGLAFEPPVKTVESGSVLVLDLGFQLNEKPQAEDASLLMNALTGNAVRQASLRRVLNGINRARGDSRISGLLLRGNLLLDGGGSLVSLHEIRQALVNFAREKPLYAFMKGDNMRDFYLKSAATELYSDPYALVDFRGLRAERIYMGEAFKRIGVEVQVSKYEEFKTAGEAFQRGSMSEPERKQLRLLVDDIWYSLASDIAASRGLELAELNIIANSELVLYGPEIHEKGLSDEIIAEDILIDRLTGQAGYDPVRDSFRQFDFIEYAKMGSSPMPEFGLPTAGNRIAVVYIEGIQVDGEGGAGLAGADTINKTLRELQGDDSVRAVVLRVNSVGGSASAASRMVREIELLKRAKPVIVSMGGVAASGGYMVAALGDDIFTEPTTITGSIGVVSMLFNIEGLAEKLSLSFEGVETHRFAGAFSPGRRKTEEEMRQIQALGAQTYEEFLTLVSVNRELSMEETLAVAKGRVWTGRAALVNGLADEEGGLMAAIQRAADRAGIGNDYVVIDRPRPLTLEQKIQKFLTGTQAADPGASLPDHPLLQDLENELRRLASMNDPHGQYTILPYTLNIR